MPQLVLAADRLDREVRSLRGWDLVDGRLHAEYRFADFAEAFGFMSAVAVVAAELDHHPDWSNSYSRVVIDLVTHDLGGVTERDLALARRITALAGAARAA